jgi:copper transport protein
MIKVLVLLLGMLAFSNAAFAHSQLIDSHPRESEVLRDPPATIALVFDEPVAPLVLGMLGPDGTPVVIGPPQVSDATLSLAVPTHLANGSYLLNWRVASADGHPVGGTLSFAIGDATGAAPNMAAAPAAPRLAGGLYPAIAVTGLALLAGLLFGIGRMTFNAWASPPDGLGGREYLPALLLALVAAPVSLALQGMDALAAPWSAVLDGTCWRAGISTSYGRLVGIAEAAVLVGLIASVAGGQRLRRVLSLLAMLLLGWALASSGHAATATPGPAAGVVVFLHVVIAACWLGALAGLPALLLAGSGEAALRRFSAVATWGVAMLVATGALLAYWQLAAPADLWRTAYGKVLSAKLLLVLAMLVLAAINRWRLTGPALQGDIRRLGALVRNIRWELMLAAAVLGAVTLWRFTPPPRSLPVAYPSVHLHGSGVSGSAVVHEIPGGHARITLVITRDDGTPLAPKEVSVTLSNKDAGVEAMTRAAHPVDGSPGAWAVPDAPLLASGLWGLHVDALVSDFDSVSLDGVAMLRLHMKAR